MTDTWDTGRLGGIEGGDCEDLEPMPLPLDIASKRQDPFWGQVFASVLGGYVAQGYHARDAMEQAKRAADLAMRVRSDT